MSKTAIQAAKIGATGAIGAALLGGLFLLLQPIASNYLNRTDEVRIADASFALTSAGPALDVVISNPTKATQAIVSVNVSLAQSGSGLMMIGTSTYRLSGELTIDRRSGAAQGLVQGDDHVGYPFDGLFDQHARGDWSIDLTIPVREQLAPGDSRSILFVVPETIAILADWGRLLGVGLPAPPALTGGGGETCIFQNISQERKTSSEYGIS